jgi:hypothetical protein
VLANVTMERGDFDAIASFEEGIAAVPEVRHAERLFGVPDYLLRVVAPRSRVKDGAIVPLATHDLAIGLPGRGAGWRGSAGGLAFPDLGGNGPATGGEEARMSGRTPATGATTSAASSISGRS